MKIELGQDVWFIEYTGRHGSEIRIPYVKQSFIDKISSDETFSISSWTNQEIFYTLEEAEKERQRKYKELTFRIMDQLNNGDNIDIDYETLNFNFKQKFKPGQEVFIIIDDTCNTYSGKKITNKISIQKSIVENVSIQYKNEINYKIEAVYSIPQNYIFASYEEAKNEANRMAEKIIAGYKLFVKEDSESDVETSLTEKEHSQLSLRFF